jgi:hypothetical protein
LPEPFDLDSKLRQHARVELAVSRRNGLITPSFVKVVNGNALIFPGNVAVHSADALENFLWMTPSRFYFF